MAWKNYDPKEQMPDHYSNLKQHGVIIPTTDDVAFKRYKIWRWLYNKFEVAERQGLECGLIPQTPTEFPVVVKPVYNLMGGSINASVIHNMEEYNKLTDPGLCWTPFHFGEHYSLDIILLDGKIVEMFAFRGEKLQFGAFDYWELDNNDDDLLELVTPWVEQYLYGYSGCLNVEVIGEYIIEAQLRMGDIDRLGDPHLMKAIWKLYNEDVWEYQRNYATPETFYLAALFAQPHKTFNLNIELLDYILGESLTYYQIDDNSKYHENPPHGNRIAIFCDNEWENVEWARNICAAMVKPEIDGRYLQPLEGYVELTI